MLEIKVICTVPIPWLSGILSPQSQYYLFSDRENNENKKARTLPGYSREEPSLFFVIQHPVRNPGRQVVYCNSLQCPLQPDPGQFVRRTDQVLLRVGAPDDRTVRPDLRACGDDIRDPF